MASQESSDYRSAITEKSSDSEAEIKIENLKSRRIQSTQIRPLGLKLGVGNLPIPYKLMLWKVKTAAD